METPPNMQFLFVRSFLGRLRGLLGRNHLPAHQAVVLAPCSAIHTYLMRFSIDVYFLNQQGVVLERRSHLPPWRTASCAGAFYVVETSAGALMPEHWAPGTQLNLNSKEHSHETNPSFS
jgi:uncharacterized protein